MYNTYNDCMRKTNTNWENECTYEWMKSKEGDCKCDISTFDVGWSVSC